jgi:sigma-B regulation protein RsbU (phosphoserine phosphatase)
VAGHGLTSGLIMLMVQSVIGALGRRYPDASPSDVVGSLNTVLWENIRHRLKNDEHVTLSLLRYYRDGRLVFAGAHEDILVFRARKGKCERFETPGTWLGAMRDVAKFTRNSLIQLEPGDTVVLHTDGITEARNREQQLFGLERLVQLVTDSAALPVKELCSLLHSAAMTHAHTRDDDVTLLVMRYRP